MNEVVTLAQNASCFEQVLSGALFFGFVYYVMYIPLRAKRNGVKLPNLFVRVKNDLTALWGKIRN